MTPEFDALFREQADVHSRKKSLKELSKLTGFAPSYCWQQIQRHIPESEKQSVSRGARAGRNSRLSREDC